MCKGGPFLGGGGGTSSQPYKDVWSQDGGIWVIFQHLGRELVHSYIGIWVGFPLGVSPL